MSMMTEYSINMNFLKNGKQLMMLRTPISYFIVRANCPSRAQMSKSRSTECLYCSCSFGVTTPSGPGSPHSRGF
jgi:hypothetical protein